MKCFPTIILLLLSSNLCFGQHEICFLNKSGRKVWVDNFTILGTGSAPYELQPDSANYQSIAFETTNPLILNFVAIPEKGPYGSGDGIYYLLKTGDSLIIQLDKKKKPLLVHVSSTQRTRELSFMTRHVDSIGIPLPYTLWGFNTSPLKKRLQMADLSTRDKMLDSIYMPYINSATNFCADHSLNASIGRLFRYYYLGSKISDKLFVGVKVDTSLLANLKMYYKDSLLVWSKQLDCEDCGSIPAYFRALKAVYQMQLGGNTDEQVYVDKIAALADGYNKNFLLSSYLIDRIDLADNADQLLKRYDMLCRDTLYKKQVHNNYYLHQKRSSLEAGELAMLLNPNKSEIGFSGLLKKLKGKVIYIDFWASWCKPCIEEIPYSHALRKKISEKNIEMVYISLDTDFNSWINSMKKYNLDNEFSFILPNPEKSPLKEKLNLGPIPRYIIVDTVGKIIRLEAPRPSDNETYELLLRTANYK